jgi:uncharacterized protein (DUF3820 family)
MPNFVKQVLDERDLMAEYEARPAYQRNDYLGWINRAKLPATKEKRLFQMLNELEKGGIYMKMAHPPSKKKGRRCNDQTDPLQAKSRIKNPKRK